jgi:hypothetical protein
MKTIVTVLAVTSWLCLSAQLESPPPGWSAAMKKALDLMVDGKDLEAVAIYEQFVASHANFAEGHFMLGATHESVARAAVARRAPDALTTRKKHLEAAVLHMRRARELAGRRAPFDWVRGLIDIHGVRGLNQPAEYERLVREAAALYPAEPLAQEYLRALVAGQGEPTGAPAPEDAGVTATLRAIAVGQMTYSAVCGNGYYAPTLAALARPEPGKQLGFIPGDLVPSKATDLEKYRYRFVMTAPPAPGSSASCNGVPAGGSARTFSITARPVAGSQGKSYRIDAEGVLTEIK